MKRTPPDGRQFVRELTARLVTEGSDLVLLAPAVGRWRHAPAVGNLISPGDIIGELSVLGVLYRLRAPADAAGIVTERPGPSLAEIPVPYGAVLMRLDPEASPAGVGPAAAGVGSDGDAGGLTFRTPLSGRFYVRPGPDQDPFVAVGGIVETGQTIALLEVMKTFNRVTYGGEGLPARARVLAIVPADEDDVEEGDVLLRVEPA